MGVTHHATITRGLILSAYRFGKSTRSITWRSASKSPKPVRIGSLLTCGTEVKAETKKTNRKARPENLYLECYGGHQVPATRTRNGASLSAKGARGVGFPPPAMQIRDLHGQLRDRVQAINKDEDPVAHD